MIELLAPAGNMECLKAAVLNGADAIYLGLGQFNARQRAINFNKDNFLEAMNFCHLRNVKVYLTLNTLIYPNEMKSALDTCLFAYNHGVDAVIVQDLGLANNIKKYLPKLPIHASTQCTAINANGAKNLKKLGFKRVVAGREVNLENLTKMCQEEIDIEVFIHGALCISYSGQCLMSSLNGGRSGNRGLCAQPCRLSYDIYEGEEKIDNKFILSPKDVCTIEHINEIINSGVKSLKIEGRMKTPQYVAAVVSSYRKAINQYDISKEKEKLLQVFNREGFFDSYLFKKPGENNMAYNSSKNTGLLIGKVIAVNQKKDMITILSNKKIESGDGISFGYSEHGMYIRLISHTQNSYNIIASNYYPPINCDVYLTYDKSLDKELKATYHNEYSKKNSIDLYVEFKKTQIPKISYQGISVLGEKTCELANSVFKQRIINQLSKSGNSLFLIKNIKGEIEDDAYYPVALINKMRRELLSKLEESNKVVIDNHQINLELLPDIEKKESKKISIFFYQFRKDISLDTLKVDIIYLPLSAKNKVKDKRVIFWQLEDEQPLNNTLVSNIGLLSNSSYLDFGINVTNPWTIKALNEITKVQSVTLSVELPLKMQNSILMKTDIKGEVVVYGKVPAMKSVYCPNGALYNKSECSLHQLTLKNNNQTYEVIPYCDSCTSYILSSEPINLLDKELMCDIYRLNIYNESITKINELILEIEK
ncbi:MAG: U32 family peptidase [Clostridiales bacterium]|nr:U32 family peptidase [Clostridiales bacterium]